VPGWSGESATGSRPLRPRPVHHGPAESHACVRFFSSVGMPVMDAAGEGAHRSRRPLSLRAVVVAGVVVLLCAAISILFLVWPIPLIPAETADERLAALRTALTIGAGAAGAAALLLAGRRQVHPEEAAAAIELDARERRITELYIKAVDQLGSGEAPVRLGGLHALERLAQDNPDHRQTAVDVICSYLRMPFPIEVEAASARVPATSRSPWMTTFTGSSEERQELEVRMTAQSILARHLRPLVEDTQLSNPRYWPDMSVDLTAAVLVDFQMQNCSLVSARFASCVFPGGSASSTVFSLGMSSSISQLSPRVPGSGRRTSAVGHGSEAPTSAVR
jgi:hypothetical protein